MGNGKVVWFINEGQDPAQGNGREYDVNPMTSENIEGVRAIGSHVVSPLAVFTMKSSGRFLTGTAPVILQQVTSKDVMTRSFADFTNFSFGR